MHIGLGGPENSRTSIMHRHAMLTTLTSHGRCALPVVLTLLLQALRDSTQALQNNVVAISALHGDGPFKVAWHKAAVTALAMTANSCKPCYCSWSPCDHDALCVLNRSFLARCTQHTAEAGLKLCQALAYTPASGQQHTSLCCHRDTKETTQLDRSILTADSSKQVC
jgi:hypothetical protein